MGRCVSVCWFCCCALGCDTAEYDPVGYDIVDKLPNRICRIPCIVAFLNRSQFPQDIVGVDKIDTTGSILMGNPAERKPNFNQNRPCYLSS